jgi:hypothetical protein
MSDGRLIPPNLDDRTWQGIVDEAKKLIPRYAPEWTDHNPSDFGITLIELFAWIAEQIIFRLNRVPEKNYIEFLNLWGITRNPATPAKAEITFKLTNDAVITIPQGTQVSTPPSATEDGIIFETERELNAVNLKQCVLIDESAGQYRKLTSKILEEPYETIDLDITPGSSRILLLGIIGSTDKILNLTFRLFPSTFLGSPEWQYSTNGDPGSWTPFSPLVNTNYAFEQSGNVGLLLPSNWQPQNPTDWSSVSPATPEDEISEPFFWIGIRLANSETSDMNIRLNRIAGNITPAINTVTVKEELLGISNGQPFQLFRLRNTPLYQDETGSDPLNHLVIAVKEGSEPFAVWQRVGDFTQENGNQYTCNPVTGEIGLGNYPTGDEDNPGYGRIPYEGAEIKAVSYRYVGGGQNGNVPAKTIVIQRTPTPGVAEVSNELAAREGSDQQPIEETKREAPKLVRTRDRAVTVEDYEVLARQSTTDIAKVRCLPPKKNSETTYVMEPFERTPGRVNLIIVPNEPESRQPMPSGEVISQAKAYLDERRTITSILMVSITPFYVEIGVISTVFVKPGVNTNTIRSEIQQLLFNFFHPVTGGPEGKGWEIGQDLFEPDVFKAISALPDIGYVADLDLQKNGETVTGIRLEIQDHELICASELNDTNYIITIQPEPPEF